MITCPAHRILTGRLRHPAVAKITEDSYSNCYVINIHWLAF